jgi:hypothetical protein
MVPLRCAFVVLGSRVMVMSFRVAGVAMLDSDCVLARVIRNGMRGAFSIGSRAPAGAADAGNREADQPKQCNRARGDAEKKNGFGLPREMHFLPGANRRFNIPAARPPSAGQQNTNAASTQGSEW